MLINSRASKGSWVGKLKPAMFYFFIKKVKKQNWEPTNILWSNELLLWSLPFSPENDSQHDCTELQCSDWLKYMQIITFQEQSANSNACGLNLCLSTEAWMKYWEWPWNNYKYLFEMLLYSLIFEGYQCYLCRYWKCTNNHHVVKSTNIHRRKKKKQIK